MQKPLAKGWGKGRKREKKNQTTKKITPPKEALNSFRICGEQNLSVSAWNKTYPYRKLYRMAVYHHFLHFKINTYGVMRREGSSE